MPSFCVYMFGPSPFPVLAAEVERGMSCYNNYFVKNGMRHYYDGNVPEIIQVGEHQFVECRLVNMWTIDTNVAWYVENSAF